MASALDKTTQYVYNGIGNIVSVTNNGTTTTFGYTDTAHPDRLTSLGGKAITYDANGGVTSYDGWNYTWSKGKLSSIRKNMSSFARTPTFTPILGPNKTYSFSYNGLGQRVRQSYSHYWLEGSIVPVLQGEVTAYTKDYTYDHSGRLICETIYKTLYGIGNESSKIVYLYDESGIVGMQYSNDTTATTNTYYFLRNLQGDVIAIYDTNGAEIASYSYDAWGNCTINSTTTNYSVAHANPIRYRGYYYDEDTNLYYLNARYYSPEFRRFISPDDTSYLDPETPNGLNLYCYCNNDPVNYADPSGHSVILALIFAGTFALGFGSSLFINAATNNWELDWRDFAQAGIDGLFAVAGTALAMTGICAGVSIGLGAAMGWSQYAIGTKIQGDNLTWSGSITAIVLGAIGGKLSGAGATNVKNVANHLTGLSDDGFRAAKAIATAMNRRMAGQISKRGFQGVLNLYGKTAFSAIDEAITITSEKLFKEAARNLAIYTPLANMGSGLLNYLYNLWGCI